MLSVVWIAFGTAAENPSLEKVLTGIDWKKLAKSIPDDAEFQTSVRGVFGSLTPEGMCVRLSLECLNSWDVIESVRL